MKRKFELSGMSCGGCVSSLKRALLQIPDVTEAEVRLRPQSAVLTLSKPVDVSQLQAQLSKAGHYTIKESIVA